MGQNYFNTLPLRLQLEELGKCRFMDRSEFANGCDYLKGKKIVIVGCGAQGLNQGLNLRDSGLDVSYTLREAAIVEQRQSWKNATENGFAVGTYEELNSRRRRGNEPDTRTSSTPPVIEADHAADERRRLPGLCPRLQPG